MFYSLKKEWVNTLSPKILSKEKALEYIKYFFELFKQPPIAFLKLKRENIGNII
jgi:hypothetical protein